MLRHFSSTTNNVLTVLKSHDSRTTANLRGISTPSPSIAWTSGDQGMVIRTIDEGKTWEDKRIPGTEKLFFRDIKAFDANTAYAMSAGHGEESRIYYTSNGGSTWQLQLQSNNPAEFFNGMAFWDRDHGMVLSDPVDGQFKIYKTENGGSHWSPIPLSGMPLALKGEGAFAASGSCMTVQGKSDAWFGTGINTARVFHTNDGGENWQVANTPIMHDSETSGIFSIAFKDLNNGVIVGGDYKQPERSGSNLAFTIDGGSTWQLSEISPQYYWSAVSFMPDNENILVVGPAQAGHINKDLPNTWQESWNVSLNALSFWSKNKALAVGPNGCIMEFEMTKKML